MREKPGAPVLDARLTAVAGLVREGRVVADIGCDHGQLAAFLVVSGKCPRAYACDINEKPLDKARALADGLDIRHRVRLLRTDGLDGLPLDEVDDVVVAGMGGELIARIVAGTPAAARGGLRFVLQPMTRAQELHRALYRQGFALEEERGARAGGHVYTVLAARYTGEFREIDELTAWTGLLPEGARGENTDMLREVHRALLRKAGGLRRGGHAEAERWAALAGQVLDIIHKRRDRDDGIQGGGFPQGN